MFKSDLIEYCGIMDGADTNPMIKTIIVVLNETAPTLFHKCPYDGETSVTNVTIEADKALFFVPTGTYCSDLNVFDTNKKQIANIRMINDVKNTLDIFGITEKKN
jgi:hypothetical protein